MKYLTLFLFVFAFVYANAQTVTMLQDNVASNYPFLGIGDYDTEKLLVVSNKKETYCAIWSDGLKIWLKVRNVDDDTESQIEVAEYSQNLPMPNFQEFAYLSVRQPYYLDMNNDRIVVAYLTTNNLEYDCIVRCYDLELTEIYNFTINNIPLYEFFTGNSGTDLKIAMNDDGYLSVLYKELNGLRIRRYDLDGTELTISSIHLAVAGTDYLECVDVNNSNDYALGFINIGPVGNTYTFHSFYVAKCDENGTYYQIATNSYNLHGENELSLQPGQQIHYYQYYFFELEFLHNNPNNFILSYSAAYVTATGLQFPETGGNNQLPIPVGGNNTSTGGVTEGFVPYYYIDVYDDNENRVTYDITTEELSDIGIASVANDPNIENKWPLSISSDVTNSDVVQIAIATDIGYLSGLIDLSDGAYIDSKYHTWIFGRATLQTVSLEDCRNITGGYHNFSTDQLFSGIFTGCHTDDVFAVSAHTFKRIAPLNTNDYDYNDGETISNSTQFTNTTINFNGVVHIDQDITFTGCTLNFSPESRLVIESNQSDPFAHVVMDNCVLDVIAPCDGMMWEGIEVGKDAKITFDESSLKNAHFGIANIVAFESGSESTWNTTLETYTCTWPDMSYDESTAGGDIYAVNSTFENNSVSIFYRGTTLNSTDPDYKVVGCLFTQTAPLKNKFVNPGGRRWAFVMDWGLSGVKIQGNTFMNDDLYDVGSSSLFTAYGISVLDASVLISKDPSTTIGNTFYRINTAVTCYSSHNAPMGVTVNGNDFYLNRCGVMMHAGVQYTVVNNTFASNTNKSRAAIALWGAQKTNVYNNDVSSHRTGVYLEDVDVTQHYETKVYDNDVSQNTTGVSTFGLCKKSFINCNDFTMQERANWYHDAVLQTQGVCVSEPERNLFTDSPPNDDIYLPENYNGDKYFIYNYQVISGSQADYLPIVQNNSTEWPTPSPVFPDECDDPGLNISLECDPYKTEVNPVNWGTMLGQAIMDDDIGLTKQLTYELLNYYIDQNDIENCIVTLESVPYNFARFDLLGYYLREHQYADVRTLLSEIEPDGETEELIVDYYDVLLDIAEQESFNFHLTTNQLEVIEEMASGSGTREEKMGLNYGAKSLLVLYEDKRYKIREEHYEELRLEEKNENVAPVFTAYPNPNNGSFVVSFNEEKAQLNVYTATGQKVISRLVYSGEPLKLNKPKGLYMLEIVTPTYTERTRITLQ